MPTKARKPAILVVDDDPDILELVATFLTEAGHEVETSASGTEALDLATRHPYQVAILDGMLPGVDGLSVCRAMKSMDREVFVVLMSAADRTAEIASAPEPERPDAFLLKPFPMSALLETILWRSKKPPVDSQPQPAIEGDLATTPFFRLLPRIARERRSGTLGIQSKGPPFRIYFTNGIPIFAEGGAVSTTLGRMLLNDNTITEEEYEKGLIAMHGAIRKGAVTKLGETLVRLGILRPVQIASALARQVEVKCLHAFSLKQGRFQFADDTGKVDALLAFPQTPERLLFHGLKRSMEDGDLEAILKPMAAERIYLDDRSGALLQPMAVGAKLLHTVKRLDGSATLADVLKQAESPRRDAAILLATLSLCGLLGVKESPPERKEVPVKSRAIDEEGGEFANRIVMDYLTFGGKSPWDLLGISRDADKAAIRQAGNARMRELHPSNLPASITGDVRNMATILHRAIGRATKQLLESRAEPPDRSSATPEPAAGSNLVQAEIHYREGDDQMARKDYEAAYESFRLAVFKAPAAAEYLVALGWAAFRRSPGSREAQAEGVKHLERAVEIDPSISMAYYYLARIAKLQGNEALAAVYRKQALISSPNAQDDDTDDDAGRKPIRSFTERLKFWR